MARTQHTTFRYRGMGVDLFYGVLLNIVAAVFIAVFHWFRFSGRVCVFAGIGCAALVLAVYSLTRFGQCEAEPGEEPSSDYLPADVKKNPLNAPGILYMSIMLVQAALILWAAVKMGNSPVRVGQVVLFVAFWTTAFTYLPILGLVSVMGTYRNSRDPGRSLWRDGVRVYFTKYGHLLIFPASVLVHGVVISALMAWGFWALLGKQSSFRDYLLSGSHWSQVVGPAFILGFFLAVPVHRLYERLILGRNVTPDPRLVRERYIKRAVRELEEEQRSGPLKGQMPSRYGD